MQNSFTWSKLGKPEPAASTRSSRNPLPGAASPVPGPALCAPLGVYFPSGRGISLVLGVYFPSGRGIPLKGWTGALSLPGIWWHCGGRVAGQAWHGVRGARHGLSLLRVGLQWEIPAGLGQWQWDVSPCGRGAGWWQSVPPGASLSSCSSQVWRAGQGCHPRHSPTVSHPSSTAWRARKPPSVPPWPVPSPCQHPLGNS